MKNFFIGLLIVAIIAGTAFGVKWEIDTFNNSSGNTKVEKQINEVEDIMNNETTEDDLTEDIDDLELSY